METMTVGHFRANFSEVLEKVKQGEDIVISYGKKKEKIAVLVPFARYEHKSLRIHGLLSGKASFSLSNEFQIDDEEIVRSYSIEEVFPDYVGKEQFVALRAYRNREGLTQKRLSEFTGIPQHHISEMENRKRNIGKERAKKLAEVLHCDYRQLL
jgi:prevent-host-death family protein